MRGVLVLVGILVVLLAAFVAAWPRLVDVPALEVELARVLREAGGADLRVDGAVRLELVPLPRLAIERAVLGDRIQVGTGTRFTADRVDVDLAPIALLAGRVEARGLQLVRPRLDLAGSPAPIAERLVRALAAGGPLAGLRRVEVVDGTVRLAGGPAEGSPTALDALDLSAARVGERGFEVSGSAAVAGEPVRLDLRGEPLTPDEPVALTARLEAGPRATPATLGFGGSVRPGLAEGMLRADTTRGPPPRWLAAGVGLPGTLEARLTWRAGRAQLADLRLTLPGGELRGRAAVALGATAPVLDLALEGTALEATPELVAAGRALIAGASRRQLVGRASLELASLAWRGDQVRRLRVEGGLVAGGRPDLRRLEATLPGETAFTWTGKPPPAGDDGGGGSAGAALVGELSLQAGELRPLLAWLGVAPAELPPGGLTSLDLAADVAVGPDRVELSRLRARLDASRLEGSLALATAPRPRLDLALTADRLNTAVYQAPPGSWPDWRARLAALDGTFELAVDQLGHDLLRGRGFGLRAALDAGRLELAELRVGDLAGASLDLRGAVDLPSGAWDLAGALAAPDPKPILRLLRVAAPAGIDRLAPLRLEGESRREAGVTSVGLRLTGRDAAASLDGRLVGDDAAGGELELAAAATAGDAGGLLLALGWPAPPDRAALGPLDARATARRGGGGAPTRVAVAVLAGDSEVAAEAELVTGEARPLLRGSLRAPVLGTELAAAIYETLAVSLGFPPGRPWLWPGVWPRQPLRWGWLAALDAEVAVAVAALRGAAGADLGAASLEARLRRGRLALSRLHLPVAGGRLAGAVTVERQGEGAMLGADLRLDGARAEDLAAAAAAGSGVRGRLDLAAALVGRGRSVADLVGSLAGSGELALRDGLLPGVGSGPNPDAAGVELSGPCTLSAGVLASVPPGLALTWAGGEGRLDLRLDLLAWVVQARLDAGDAARRFVGPPGRIRPVP